VDTDNRNQVLVLFKNMADEHILIKYLKIVFLKIIHTNTLGTLNLLVQIKFITQ